MDTCCKDAKYNVSSPVLVWTTPPLKASRKSKDSADLQELQPVLAMCHSAVCVEPNTVYTYVYIHTLWKKLFYTLMRCSRHWQTGKSQGKGREWLDIFTADVQNKSENKKSYGNYVPQCEDGNKELSYNWRSGLQLQYMQSSMVAVDGMRPHSPASHRDNVNNTH